MQVQDAINFLFIINPGSGAGGVDWSKEIDIFFSALSFKIEKYALPHNCNVKILKDKITATHPDKVVAVGGDGTVKLVAECLLDTEIIMGVLPAGSANGFAKELGIPADSIGALEFLLKQDTQRIHLVKINDQLCIHLADMGFNASVIKLFESRKQRGMPGYIRAAWKVLWKHQSMEVTMKIGENFIRRNAAMVVIANATRYGSGAVINPAGRLDDELFEVVIVKKVSFSEIFKMMVTHRSYDQKKTELYQTKSLTIHSRTKVHFQVDGEYLGKVTKLRANLIPAAIKIIK